MSLGRAKDKRQGESGERDRERGKGGAPGWRGELFSFYKLVQFFLKKRVNTTETGCIYAESQNDGTRERKGDRTEGRQRKGGMVDFSSSHREFQARTEHCVSNPINPLAIMNTFFQKNDNFSRQKQIVKSFNFITFLITSYLTL